MKKILSNFFNSDKTFLSFTVIAAACLFYNVVVGIVFEYYLDACYCAVYALCIIGIFVTFKNQERSAMKYLIGVVMGMITVGTVGDLIDEVAVYGESDPYWCVLMGILALCGVTYAVTHFFLSIEHRQSAVGVTIAYVCIAVYLVTVVLICAKELANLEAEAIWYTLSYFSYLFLVACVVCIDTKLDFFKPTKEEKKISDK